MQSVPLPDNEAARINALCQYQILDTEPETAFDDLTRLAASICDTPIALVSLIGATRQWFKSRIGLTITETPRNLAFCNHTILQSDVMVVPDTLADKRFVSHPGVTGEPYIRFYAGAPLITPEGHRVGTLCAIDRIPRELNSSQIEALRALSCQVVAQLELRRKVVALEHLTQEYQRSEAALRESEERFRTMADSVPFLIWMDNSDQQAIFYNQTWLSFTGRSLEQEIGHGWQQGLYPDDFQHWLSTYSKAFNVRQPYEVEYRLRRADGQYRWMLETGAPRFFPGGIFAGYTGSCIDITERKLAEADIQLLQTVTQAIFVSQDFHSALTIALQKVCEATHWEFGEAWIPNADRTRMECSPAWYSKNRSLKEFRQQSQEFSFPPGAGIPGRIWLTKQPEWHQDVSIEPDTQYPRARIAMEAGLKAALGIPIIADDQVITVLVFYMFEAREEDRRLIKLISASTELGLFIQRKQAEEEIRKSLEKERELNELKSNFISIVSHEFRTPLSTIAMSSELLEHYGHRQTEAKRQIHFRRIQSAVERMKRLLEDVLLISQGDVGKLEFSPAQMNLETFCQELIKEFQSSVELRASLVYEEELSSVLISH
jgi:PAS domain S-box-containing protein